MVAKFFMDTARIMLNKCVLLFMEQGWRSVVASIVSVNHGGGVDGNARKIEGSLSKGGSEESWSARSWVETVGVEKNVKTNRVEHVHYEV